MRKSKNTIAYVLTTNGRDVYSDMALISAMSVRLSNPNFSIAVASDKQSAQALKVAKHPLLGIIDELRVVESPYHSATHRNRSIKTRLPEIFEGPTLNLDADTLVRGSLEELFNSPFDFGAVANHNAATPNEQLWNEDQQVIQEMDWKVSLPRYINTGVIFYRNSSAVRLFYSKWHKLWAEECAKTGRGRDQPACYAALSETQLSINELPAEYNWQVVYNPRDWLLARILHFYPDPAYEQRSFGQVLQLARRIPIKKLRIYVRSCIETPSESIYSDLLSQWLKRRRAGGLVDGLGADLWLIGYKKRAIRYWLGMFKKNMLPLLNLEKWK